MNTARAISPRPCPWIHDGAPIALSGGQRSPIIKSGMTLGMVGREASARRRFADGLAGQHLRIAGEAEEIELPLGLPQVEMVALPPLLVGELEAAIAMLFEAMVQPRLHDVVRLA